MTADAPIVALGELLWDLLPAGRRAGGAPFNFAFHCHQLGHPAVIVSRVGDDDLGRDLRAEVRRLGMTDEFIQTDPDHPTGTVRVELDASGQPTYTIVEDVAWDLIEWEPRLADLARRARAVCFGTLAQRHPASRGTIWHILSHTPSSARTVCDINLRPPFHAPDVIARSARRADWLKLNDAEVADVMKALGQLTPILRGWTDTKDAATRLWAATGCGLVCITRGADGFDLRSERLAMEWPGIRVRVADTVGAGDAFTAALVTQSLKGKPLAEAARFANAYAAVVASKPGGTPRVEPAEVELLL